MKIEPLNYCSQAIKGMTKHSKKMDKNFKRVPDKYKPAMRAYIQTMDAIIPVLSSAEKFMMPTGGGLFTIDEGKQLVKFTEIPARIPYPVIALEFPYNYLDNWEANEKNVGQATKRIAIALEVGPFFSFMPKESCLLAEKLMEDKVHKTPEDGFFITEVSFMPDIDGKGTSGWSPPSCFAYMCESIKEEGQDIGTAPTPFGIYEYMVRDSIHEAKRRMIKDVQDEIFTVAQLLIALSIDSIKVIDMKVSGATNKKRSKLGRRKFDDYKILDIIIDAGVKVIHGGEAMSDRCNPRFHTRRGHLRRLHSGGFCWVRHCLVGNPDKGVLEKSYSVHK